MLLLKQPIEIDPDAWVAADAFAQSHAFVLPSHSEGIPMAVLEAWAAGLPVFMTRACNLPQGFDANAAVEIHTGDNPTFLAGALARNDLQDMGLRCRALVEANFTWDSVAERHAAIYARMVDGAHIPESVNG